MIAANLNHSPIAHGNSLDPRWAVILSGGDGMRLRPLVDRPKQYCTFVGTRTMLEHTLDRAHSMVSADQIVTVIGNGHRKFLDEPNRKTVPGLVVEQPINMGTAPGILLPTAHILEKDPNATIVVLPSDHFAYPESRLIEYIVRASECAEQYPRDLVLIGAVPDHPEIDYGWITAEDNPESAWAEDGAIPLLRVSGFREKPDIDEAHALLRRNGLWNTMMIAVKAQTLWSLARHCLPQLTDSLDTFRRILRSVRTRRLDSTVEETALAHLYQNLEPADFSADVLEHIVRHILVLPMTDVAWCDWGRPRRITESLARLRKNAALDRDPADGVSEQIRIPKVTDTELQNCGKRKNMAVPIKQSTARFGVEIRGKSMHAEAESLEDIHSLLRGQNGRVHVIDRQSKSLVLEGNIEQVREALNSLTALNANSAQAETGERT
jgi:mannose-1-phosphate guanylyltransferase